MCHRYPYGSFAESSGERIRGNRRGLVTNARDIEGQQRKESAWLLNKRDSVCPELRSAKAITRSERRETSSRLSITSINYCLLSSVVNR